ncbi:DUF1127 domain-containing protein [Rhodococcus sp. IEGM1300]
MKHLLDVLNTSAPEKTRSRLPVRLIRGIFASLERSRTRRLLGQLNDQQLSDLGLSHSDRLNEMDKPFWR